MRGTAGGEANLSSNVAQYWASLQRALHSSSKTTRSYSCLFARIMQCVGYMRGYLSRVLEEARGAPPSLDAVLCRARMFGFVGFPLGGLSLLPLLLSGILALVAWRGGILLAECLLRRRVQELSFTAEVASVCALFHISHEPRSSQRF